jgi:16S rRNA (adenine1518-N6/adenine1519-N6)-dimethyltransferase
VADKGEIMSENLSRKDRIFARLQELGAEPKRSLGQNFLISDMVVDRILFAVKHDTFSELVEVGPGLGALTEDLIKLGKPMKLIELDRLFADYWRTRAAASVTPMQLIEGDALQISWGTLGIQPGALFVANLPYQISSSIVIERSLDPAGIVRMILMFQKEVAQRLMARASTKEYGLLTVIGQTFWDISTVCDAGPRDFFPPPNVASRVLLFRRRVTPELQTPEEAQGFLRFAKAAFSHRRKLLLRNLQGGFFNGDKDSGSLLEGIFVRAGLLNTARAEELDPNAFVRLYQAVTSGMGS